MMAWRDQAIILEWQEVIEGIVIAVASLVNFIYKRLVHDILCLMDAHADLSFLFL